MPKVKHSSACHSSGSCLYSCKCMLLVKLNLKKRKNIHGYKRFRTLLMTPKAPT